MSRQTILPSHVGSLHNCFGHSHTATAAIQSSSSDDNRGQPRPTFTQVPQQHGNRCSQRSDERKAPRQEPERGDCGSIGASVAGALLAYRVDRSPTKPIAVSQETMVTLGIVTVGTVEDPGTGAGPPPRHHRNKNWKSGPQKDKIVEVRRRGTNPSP